MKKTTEDSRSGQQALARIRAAVGGVFGIATEGLTDAQIATAVERIAVAAGGVPGVGLLSRDL